jgi:hypothetical protein
MMMGRPWKPAVELEAALGRGELSFAIVLAGEVSADRKRPLDLDTALAFLPLVAEQRPGEYDAYALRWLGRWLSETHAHSINRAAELAALLADLPADPDADARIRSLIAH